jgi:hypothetical protein
MTTSARLTSAQAAAIDNAIGALAVADKLVNQRSLAVIAADHGTTFEGIMAHFGSFNITEYREKYGHPHYC